MRILFHAPGTTGSGHIVRGLSVASALRRQGIPHDFAILCADTPYAELARRFGTSVATHKLEREEAFSPEHRHESALYAAIIAFAPDILIVDQFWFGLHSFVGDLRCKKILLTFQMHPRVFHLKIGENEYLFRPEDYDIILRTEPGYEVPFASREINPMIIRNRDELPGRREAREGLSLAENSKAFLFACSGENEQVADAWKNFSYLEGEGWQVVRTEHRQGGLFPVIDWYAAFDLIVCGAGYNAFWETRWLAMDAFYVPFPRLHEDQARRPALFSDYQFTLNGADELVRILSAI